MSDYNDASELKLVPSSPLTFSQDRTIGEDGSHIELIGVSSPASGGDFDEMTFPDAPTTEHHYVSINYHV
jgi:hypothetical protein